MTLTPIRQTLITLLSDGQFHSGEQLGEQLGISRAAVSKHMAALKELGLDLFSLTGKGYRLAVPMALYDEAQLQALAPMAPVHCFPVIDSTNQYLLEQVNQLSSGESCLAECQTAGRGRRGKPWVSPFGCQLILSMYWRLEQGMAAAMGLSLAVGVAVVQALESLGYPGVELKWPNDLYYQGRKLAGILVEMSGSAGASCHLVIGVGLNLAMPSREGSGSIRPGPNCATSSRNWWIAICWPAGCSITCSRPCSPSNRVVSPASWRTGTGSITSPAGRCGC